MNPKLVSPWKRPNSSNYWFRLVIPMRYRPKVGQAEIKQSLMTPDLGEARRLCAQLQADWLTKFANFDIELASAASANGIEIVDQYLDHQAAERGGLEAVVAYELAGLALAESAYIDAMTDVDFYGNTTVKLPPHPLSETPYPDFRSDSERATIARRRIMLSQGSITNVLPGREAAKRALALRFWLLGSDFVEQAFEHAGQSVTQDSPEFAAGGEHFLQRLLRHPIPEIDEIEATCPLPAMIAPRVNNKFEPKESLPAPIVNSPPNFDGPLGRVRLFPVTSEGRTLSAVFDAWSAAQPRDSAKLCDEWGVAIRRFVELFGDIAVTEIDGDMVADFRDAMFRLPSRPRHDIGALPIMKQIELAAEDGLPCLSGPTVAKLMTGLRVVLGYACDPLRIIRHNPAVGVKTANAKSEDDARLPFDANDLKVILGNPLILDPKSEFTDAEFWLQVNAPLSGMRLEEMGKLRPQNILCEHGIWYFAIERDRAVRRKAIAAEGGIQKRSKTSSSYRHVPIHWLLIEAGFLEFAAARLASGADWLFEELDNNEKYGNRTKSVSRRLIRHFRSIGITDKEKVFYSFRHTMKRECRRRPMKEEIADLLAGHAPDSVGRKYGAGAALSTLKSAVDMIYYEEVDWDPIVAAGKARVLQMQLGRAL